MNKGGRNGEARTMVLVNKHTATGGDIPQGICADVKNDFFICSF